MNNSNNKNDMKERLPINRGVNTPIEFKGLKAQYIAYLCIGLLALLLLFTILYICGVPVYLLLAITAIAGFSLFSTVFRYSNKYGTYGLMKKAGHARLPGSIKGQRICLLMKKAANNF